MGRRIRGRRDNPLLKPELGGQTFADVVLALKAMGREPDARAVAEADQGMAAHEVRYRREPSQWARDMLLKRLPPKKRGPSQQPYRPAVVRELIDLVRPIAISDEEARMWVAEFLNLSENRIRQLSRQ